MRRASRPLVTRVIATALIAVAVFAAAGSGVAAAAVDGSPAAPAADASPGADAGDLWFAPELDWGADAPEGYARRLGETPPAYGIRLAYPLDAAAERGWQRAATAAAAQGAALILTFEPTKDLDELAAADARALADTLDRVHAAYGTEQRVRFAPEMNGSWVRWGQQPTAYVRAFETVADAVHAGSSGAETVWVPSYGAGYPFDRADGRLDDLSARDEQTLDTDADGLLTEADDPYGPYFPRADAVDRVGLTLYYFGKGEAAAAAGRDVPLERNDAPESGEVAQRLAERWGYTVAQPQSFTERFARADRPMAIDTGALFDPARAGDDELSVKRGWWQQVLNELPAHPHIDTVSWLEVERVEAEAGGAEADWRATADPRVAEALRADLVATGRFAWAPVTPPVTADEGLSSLSPLTEPAGSERPTVAAWTMAGAAIALLLAFVVSRLLPRWRYRHEAHERDLRLDVVRGVAIAGGALAVLASAGPLAVASQAVLSVTGAELFVAISGIVMGLGYRRRLDALGVGDSLARGWRRAGRLYAVTLSVIVAVFAVGFLPFLDTTTVTTLTDPSTGRVYDLYPNAERLLDYPPPWYAVRDLLLLRMSPWPIVILGLFIALALLAPLFLALLRRRLWWVVVAVSITAYAVSIALPDAILLPTAFDAVYPLLAWQLPFVLGLVVGYHRAAISRLLRRPGGMTVATVIVPAWAAAAITGVTAPVLGVITPSAPGGLDLVRLGDSAVLLAVALAVLTAVWVPVDRVWRAVWVPLGQASLAVFCAQLLLLILIASVPALDVDDPLVATLVATGGLLALWLLAIALRRRAASRVTPR